MANSHTIVVTSNVNDSRNSSNHFYNVLGTPLDLSQGKWQVAIKKMIYLNAFMNIIDESISVTRHFVVPTDDQWWWEPWKLNDSASGLEPHAYYKDWILINKFTYDEDSTGINIIIKGTANISKVRFVVETKWKNGHHAYKPYTESVSKGETKTVPFWIGAYGKVEWFRLLIAYDITEEHVIPSGNYPKVNDLLTAITNLNIPGVLLSHDADGLMNIQLQDSKIVQLRLNKLLHLTLGFDNAEITTSTKARHFPQMNRGKFAFFIYSNLVHLVRVGDIEAPLMDVISIPKREYADIISLDVVNPIYSPVALKHVNEIEIMLATDSGEMIKFDNRTGNAKTLMVLHFMQVI